MQFGPPELPPLLAERLHEILNGVSAAPPSGKLRAFHDAARRVAGQIIGPDYRKVDAADRLWDTARIHGLVDETDPDSVDEIQSHLADAFKNPLTSDDDEPLQNGVALDLGAEVRRLAALGVLDYERERKSAADRLNVRASVLDAFVKKERETSDGSGGQGRALSLRESEPWPEPVDGAELLSDLSTAIRRHVVMPDHTADAAALWVAHTYLLHCFGISPRLAITSPEKGCGKTTLLDVLSHIAARPLSTANATAAAIFRVVEACRPTLLIDEADTFLSDNEELRGVLNSGHRQGGSVIRTVGDDHEPREFSTYSACAIALIGKLPATLQDRSVPVELQRRLMDESVEPFRFDRAEHLDLLGRRLARWALDNEARVRGAEPEMPEGVVNRAADNWRPLLAIADTAHAGWTERARAALRHSGAAVDEQSVRVLLLSDIRAIFVERELDRMTSADLVNSLVAIEGRPWAEWKAGKPITQNALARQLKHFRQSEDLKIAPGSIRTGDGTPKGYHLAQFEDAFARYLSP